MKLVLKLKRIYFELCTHVVERLHRCILKYRPLIILANGAILFYTLLIWLWFYINKYYYKWSKPLWRV